MYTWHVQSDYYELTASGGVSRPVRVFQINPGCISLVTKATEDNMYMYYVCTVSIVVIDSRMGVGVYIKYGIQYIN